MSKKGFTLIELLAVIVILAIIALIAVPIVLNIIEDTKNSALLRSADFYLDAVELSIAEKVLDGGSIDGEYFIDTNGDICIEENCIKVEVSGQKPTSGKIIIEEGKIKDIELTLGGKNISKTSSGNLVIKEYNTYLVTYTNIDNTSNLPTSIEGGENIVIDLTGKNIPEDKIQVKVNNEVVTNYIYDGNKLTINNVNGNVEVIKALDTYLVTYTGLNDITNLSTEVIEGSTLEIDLTSYDITENRLVIKINNEEIDEYIYEDGILIINNISGNIEIIVKDIYIVTYENIENTSGLPAEVIEGSTLEIDLSGKNITANKLEIKVNNEIVTNYTYLNNTLVITNVTGNVEVKRILETYTVTYENMDNTSGLPTEVIEGNTLTVDLTGKNIPSNKLQVKVNNELITNYTYSNNTLVITNVTGNIEIIRTLETYTVKYEFIDANDAKNLQATITEGETLTVDLKNKSILDSSITVKVNGQTTNNYTYTNYVLTLPNVTGNVVVTGSLPAFSTDSWETIISNVKSGNTDSYKAGDKKTITLTGTLTGTYVVRLANKSSDDPVCSNDAYSQTACGFVIEFVDIITTYQMNDSQSNAGGWPASKMRKYVTPVIDETTGELIEGSGVIYNAIPSVIRDSIIDTRVVSGYEEGKSTNYITIDKLYLLSTKEVYGSASGSDKVSTETRKLDYYKNAGVFSSKYSGAIKYLNGTAKDWWLRSASSSNKLRFHHVLSDGNSSYLFSSYAFGVAPAFRLG